MNLPLCAWCGEPITERARRKRTDSLMIMIDHRQDPHRPRYGWHGDCAKADPVYPYGPDDADRTRPTAEALATIEARGPGRVVRRVKP